MSGTVCSKAIYRTKVCRYNWHSAGSLGWPFPMVEYSVYFSNKIYGSNFIEQHTHTHTHPFNGPFTGTTQVSRYQKGKTNLDFTEAKDSEWQWHQLGHYASLHLSPDR